MWATFHAQLCYQLIFRSLKWMRSSWTICCWTCPTICYGLRGIVPQFCVRSISGCVRPKDEQVTFAICCSPFTRWHCLMRLAGSMLPPVTDRGTPSVLATLKLDFMEIWRSINVDTAQSWSSVRFQPSSSTDGSWVFQNDQRSCRSYHSPYPFNSSTWQEQGGDEDRNAFTTGELFGNLLCKSTV
jgi:hypothetical protein